MATFERDTHSERASETATVVRNAGIRCGIKTGACFDSLA
jgi:hypothetical protein